MTNLNEHHFIKKIYADQRRPETIPPPLKKPKSKKSIWLAASALIILVLLSAFTGFMLALFSRFLVFETILTIMPGEKLLSETNILILGLDGAEQIHRSDTIVVVHIDPKKNMANVVSIPRDTLVDIPGRGLDKINHAYAFGGAELSRTAVENFLGIKIPYYLTVDTGNLSQLIDEIGGVTIDVEKRMYYIDNAQNLFVDLKPGLQKLNGNNALSYLRYRYDDGDLSRILRQQKFMHALAYQMMSKENIIKSPQLILKLFSFLGTNLNTREILGLAINMRKIVDFGQIHTASLPGSDIMIDGIYYMKPDLDLVKKTVAEYLKGST